MKTVERCSEQRETGRGREEREKQEERASQPRRERKGEYKILQHKIDILQHEKHFESSQPETAFQRNKGNFIALAI